MPLVRFQFSTMNLKLVEKKEQFDQIISDQQPISSSKSKENKRTQNNQLSQQHNNNSYNKDVQQQDKIIPRWGHVTLNERIVNKRQKAFNKQSIDYQGYHRTVNFDLSQEIKDEIEINQQFLLSLFKTHSSVLKSHEIRKLMTQSILKIIDTFKEKQWNTNGITSTLVKKLLQMTEVYLQNKTNDNKVKHINEVSKDCIQKLFYDIHKHWRMSFIQNQNCEDKTVNYKLKSFNFLPDLYKPYKSRQINRNCHVRQRKFFQNQNKHKFLNSLHQDTKDLLQSYQQIEKNNLNQKEQSKSTLKRICYLAEKYGLQKNNQIQDFLLQKYQIDKSKNFKQFQQNQNLKLNRKKMQLNQKAITRSCKIPYVRKSYKEEETYEEYFENLNKKKYKKSLKKDLSWQKVFKSLQSSHQAQIYQESQQQQLVKNNLNSEKYQKQNNQRQFSSKEIQQVLRNLQSLIQPTTNIFTYFYTGKKRGRKSKIKANLQSNNQVQDTQQQNSFDSSSKSNKVQELFDKQDNNISVQTFYDPQQENIQ